MTSKSRATGAPEGSRVVRTAENWIVAAKGLQLSAHRPADDTWLEADGHDETAVRRVARSLSRGLGEDELSVLVTRAFGRRGRGVRRALEAHRVLRPVEAPSGPRVSGRGALAEHARWLAARGGWRLPPVDCPARLHARTPRPDRSTALAMGRVVLLVGPEGCPGCAVLRVLGRWGAKAGGRDPWALRGSLSRRNTRALLAECWRSAEQRPLAPGEAIGVRLHEGSRRGRVIAHADCPRCRPDRRALAEVIDQTRQALSSPRRPRRLDLRVADDPLSPMEIQVIPGPRGRYPLDVPFVWGSVHMVRGDGPRILDRSTNGGIYANAPELDTCRLLAVSEGVERYELRGARPHAWLPAGARRGPLSIPVLREPPLRGDRGSPAHERSYCAALELTSGAAVLVPYEAVAVDPPPGLAPGASRVDPFYTGGASHRTLREAVVHATVELLKRDAFVISWYRRRALTRLSLPRSPPALVRRRLDYLRRHHLDIELFDLTLELPLPMVLLRLTARRRRGNWPRGGSLLVPAGGFTPLEALGHALKLACAQCVSLIVHHHPSKDPLDPAAVRSLARTVRFWPLMARYLDPAHAEDHAFLSGADTARLEDRPGHGARTPGARYRLLERWLRERGHRWLAVRLTGPVATAVGLEVCRVLVPGFLALAPSRRATQLDAARMHADWPGARPGLHRAPHPIY